MPALPRAKPGSDQPLGGARFGNDRNDSVLDPGCRVWDLDNLYVTDGAFMPTSGTAGKTVSGQFRNHSRAPSVEMTSSRARERHDRIRRSPGPKRL